MLQTDVKLGTENYTLEINIKIKRLKVSLKIKSMWLTSALMVVFAKQEAWAFRVIKIFHKVCLMHFQYISLREKCPFKERISPYSVQVQENTDQK